MSLVDVLGGIKILEEVESPINGKLTVVKDVAWGVHVQAGGITQSGGVCTKVWNTVFKKVSHQQLKINNCLVLGLGAGGILKPLKKYWPEAKITGVEIDPIMIDLGKKYFDLASVDIVVGDTEEFLKKNKEKFDLICVDMYLGQKIPKKFNTKEFAQRVSELVHENGVAIFNRLYFGDKRRLAEEFHRKLIHTFKKVRPIYPEANVMYACNI